MTTLTAPRSLLFTSLHPLHIFINLYHLTIPTVSHSQPSVRILIYAAERGVDPVIVLMRFSTMVGGHITSSLSYQTCHIA